MPSVSVERDQAGADRHHFSIGEEKENKARACALDGNREKEDRRDLKMAIFVPEARTARRGGA